MLHYSPTRLSYCTRMETLNRITPLDPLQYLNLECQSSCENMGHQHPSLYEDLVYNPNGTNRIKQ